MEDIALSIMIMICSVMAFLAGMKTGHNKGYKEGYLQGVEKGIRNTTNCLMRTLKAAGYKDSWINGLLTKMGEHIKP